MTIISTVPMRKERRYALPAQNDLHSVENFFTLDEDNLFPLHTHQGRMKNLLRVVATSIFPMSHNGLVRSRPLQRCLTRSTMPEDGQKGTIAHKAASHTCRESVGSLGNSISPHQYVIAVMQTTCRWDCGHS